MEEIIKKYLEERAKEDATIAANLKKENKSIEGCCKYITEQARKAATKNVAMIEDKVVFGWAVHYYDEDEIEAEKKPATETETHIVSGAKSAGKGKKGTQKPKFVQCDLFGELGI